jgi:hypothetical protein
MLIVKSATATTTTMLTLCGVVLFQDRRLLSKDEQKESTVFEETYIGL